MIVTLDVIAFLCAVTGVGLLGFSFVFGEPRFMTAALGMTWLALFWGAVSASCQQRWLPLGLYLAGSLVTGVVAWRSWPDSWNPWHTLRDAVETGRLLRR